MCDAVDRVINDAQVLNKNDPNFPKYEVLKNMLVILERKNPEINQSQSNSKFRGGKRNRFEDPDDEMIANPIKSIKGFKKALSEVNQNKQLKKQVNALKIKLSELTATVNKKNFGNRGGKGGKEGQGKGGGGKGAGHGERKGAPTSIEDIRDNCWKCGSTGHMGKHYSKPN